MSLDVETLEELDLRMQIIGAFDTRVLELYEGKLLRGSAHPYIGMEAIAVQLERAVLPSLADLVQAVEGLVGDRGAVDHG